MNYKKFLLYITMFVCSIQNIYSSVANLLQGMSDADLEALIKQGEAQLDYYMNHATQEEKEAFDKAMTETLQSFNEEDWNALQGVAEKIEKTTPVQEPVPTTLPAQKTTDDVQKVTPTKPVVHSVEDKVKEILLSIIKSIDKILNTIHGSKDLERHMKPWVEKSAFQELQKLLHFINRPHNIRRLATTSQENTDFIATLETFQKVLNEEEKHLRIYEDEFGRVKEIQEEEAQITIENIQNALTKGINIILPKTKEFLAKYDPEALEFAKTKDEQATKALEQERQNVRASLAPQPTNYYKGGGYGTGGNYTSSQDAMPQRRHRPGQTGGYNPSSSDQSRHSSNSRFGPTGGTGGQSKAGASGKKDTETQKDQKDTNVAASSVPKYINALKEHFDMFETDKQLEEVIKQAVNTYPKAESGVDQNAFVEEMQQYIAQTKKSIKSVSEEVADLESITHPLASGVKDFSKDDAKTLLENKYFKKLTDKVDAFIKMIEDFKNKLSIKYKANKTHLDDAHQNPYIQLHNQIDSLYSLEDALLNIDSYLQSAHKRLKARSKGEAIQEEKQTRAHKHHNPLM